MLTVKAALFSCSILTSTVESFKELPNVMLMNMCEHAKSTSNLDKPNRQKKYICQNKNIYTVASSWFFFHPVRYKVCTAFLMTVTAVWDMTQW
jgi:hypothetical protein